MNQFNLCLHDSFTLRVSVGVTTTIASNTPAPNPAQKV
jgi:hypothetical protein